LAAGGSASWGFPRFCGISPTHFCGEAQSSCSGALMGEQHEAETARGLREGQVEAWRKLYDVYAQRVWCSVARLAAARSARQYDPSRGSLWAWLGGIARRQVALHFRRQRRHHRMQNVDGRWAADAEGIVRWLEDREAGPPEELASAELRSLVRVALAELPDHYQALLSARYFEAVPVQQIAREEDSSPTAIRSRLARARRAFRRAFARNVNCRQETGEHRGC
jgi:RNA polymerase sigma-70 factor (ECF subfamily)